MKVGSVGEGFLKGSRAVYGLKPTLHCRDTVRLRSMIVMDLRATATVRWQTGEEEEISTLDLVPYKNVDE